MLSELMNSFLIKYPHMCIEAQEYLNDHIYALDLQEWVENKDDGPEW